MTTELLWQLSSLVHGKTGQRLLIFAGLHICGHWTIPSPKVSKLWSFHSLLNILLNFVDLGEHWRWIYAIRTVILDIKLVIFELFESLGISAQIYSILQARYTISSLIRAGVPCTNNRILWICGTISVPRLALVECRHLHSYLMSLSSTFQFGVLNKAGYLISKIVLLICFIHLWRYPILIIIVFVILSISILLSGHLFLLSRSFEAWRGGEATV